MPAEIKGGVILTQESSVLDLVETNLENGGAEPKQKPIVAESYGRRDYLLRRYLAGADLVSLLVTIIAVNQLAPLKHRVSIYSVGTLVLFPLWIVINKLYGLYDRDIKRISHSTIDDLPWLLHATIIGTALAYTLRWLLGVGALPAHVAAFFFIAFSTGVILRALVRTFMRRSLGPERVLFVGGAPEEELLVRKMRSHREYGLEPLGSLSDAAEGDLGVSQEHNGLPNLGGIGELERVVSEHNIERVVVCQAQSGDATFDLLDIVHRCKELSLKVSVVPQLFDLIGPSVEIDSVEGLTVLGINPPVLSRSSLLMKRSLDIVGSILVLILTLPLTVTIALAIKITSSGPIFFKQQRIGKSGRAFRLFKFRTMFEDAEQAYEQLLADSEDPHCLILKQDQRITRLGRFLRRTSIDELPQLWNVLKGEMSLVGPRPLIELDDRHVVGWARSRLDLTPGISGYWQVLGRNNIPFAEMVKLDYLYVTNWSLWGDIKLVLRTLPAVLKRRGAI